MGRKRREKKGKMIERKKKEIEKKKEKMEKMKFNVNSLDTWLIVPVIYACVKD